MMKGNSNSHKRKSTLNSDVNPPASKQPEEDFTREEKYDEDEDENNNDNDHVSDERAGGDAIFGVDHQNEVEYLLGDEGPTSTEEELEKGLLTKDADEDNESSTRHFSHGCHLIQGKLDHGMEDYIFAQHRHINGYDLGLYAIFDGHSGRDAAKYLQSHLFGNILSEGGSTAVAAILINGVKLLVANVGDSRAILCRNGLAKQITVDHEPQKEKDLVESRGGFVSKRPGCVPRVDGQLAMTRAFGDGKLKEHITAEPDVMVQKIDEDTDFIILASDGLWKVMTNQEACDCVKDIDDAQKASKNLIKEALSQGSYDDISCIVVMF